MKRIFFVLFFCGVAVPLAAQFFYNETCRNATGIFQYYGDAVGYTAGLGIDPPGEGWLRLVETRTGQNGYVLLDRTFPSTMGVTIEFDFKVWSSSSTGIADGFCVFLFDGGGTQPFQIGTSGGYLGYINLRPAYLGVGIDEWGNFWSAAGGSGTRPSAITVADASYHYVVGTPAYLGTGTYLEYPTPSSARPSDAVYYRRVRIEIIPIANGMSVTVYLKMQPGGVFAAVLGPADVIQTTPALLRLGFNAATGAAYGYHEVRDVVVRTPGDMSVFKSSDEGCAARRDSVVIHTIISNSTNAAVAGVSVVDTLPAGYVVTGGAPAVSSAGTLYGFAATTLPDGRTRCTYTVDVAAEAVVYITYTGAFAVRPPGGVYTSSAGITPPPAFADQNEGDNYSTFTGCVASFPLTSDTVVVARGDEVRFDALANDSIPCNGNATPVGIVPSYGQHHGSATLSADGTFSYRATAAGLDSMAYYVLCHGDSSVATVYVLVLQPLAQRYVACHGAAVVMGFTPTAGVTYHWYANATGGAILHSAATMSVVKGSPADIGQWWVEAVYDGMPFPRIRVTLTASDNCGAVDPAGCARSGTLLFKEDFGGNNASDPATKPSGIPQVVGYTYLADLNGQGVYTITKQTPSATHPNSWYTLDDHTYPNDPSQGYLIGFDASAAPGQFYQYHITDLCIGTELYFSAWLASMISNLTHTDKSNLIFTVENTAGDVLTRYYTGNLPDADPQWKIYGFAFTAPEASVILKIINNGTGSTGNDFVMDDIEIRFCAPQVAIDTRDTAVCAAAVISLDGNYTDDGLFGNDLTARWEYSSTGAIHIPTDWTTVAGSESAVTNGTINSHHPLPNITPAQAGYYRLVVGNTENIANYNCRAMSPVVHIQVDTVSPAPTIFTADPTTFCTGDTAQLESHALDAISYQWYLNDAPIANANAASYAAAAAGAYTLRTQDSHHCPSAPSPPITITVHPYPATPILTATAATFCTGQAITLAAQSADAEVYYWFLNNTPAGTTSAATLEVAAGGTYRVEVSGTGNCRTDVPSNDVLLTALPVPADPVLMAGATDFCAGLSVTLVATAAGATAYEWYKDNLPVAGPSANTYTVYETGTYTARARNNYPCYAFNAADAIRVTVHPLPIPPVITADGPPFYRDHDYSLYIQTPEDSVVYYWYRNAAPTGVRDDRYPLPLLDAAGAGVYTVEAHSAYDCRAWSEPFVITVEPSPLFIPNIFTPNDDGVNDNFRITGLHNYEGNDLQVLNKRGKQVFSSVNYHNEWYGDNQPDDVYYYRLRLRDKDNVITMYEGYVHIKR
ncbi:MAG: gliding motility-associated C-terminal domain-containing protein [Prevotellaceae bacterium]|jgi:gliding motility-associated-like protein|nr:gliding motility-associated C-terminal domain-containing protein [Prevotellaceae bacterium]